MLRIPRWRPDRRITENAPPEARRLYARYRALTWVGHVGLNVALVSVVALFISYRMGVDAYDALMTVWFITIFASLIAYPAGEYFMNRLEREFPAAVLRQEEGQTVPMRGTCHLGDDITREGWPRPTEGSIVFTDDDLRIAPATCSCGRMYLWVWRRVPQSYFEYLIPIDASDLARIQSDISSAPRNVTDKWIAAERAVTALALDRPSIEYSPSPPPAILRWLPPGELFAFTMSPM